MSPSMRREWIEIPLFQCRRLCDQSPSMRREWIEMVIDTLVVSSFMASPSMRREWIEISHSISGVTPVKSPSMRREWIEITKSNSGSTSSYVSLHAEGVD